MDDQELEYEELEKVDETSDHDGSVDYQGDVADEDIERNVTMEREKAFGLTSTQAKYLKVTSAEARALRIELNAGLGTHEMSAALVSGVDGMHDYQIMKVFAAFNATKVFKMNESQSIVEFVGRHFVVSMMLNMTKMIRRVRGKRQPNEDGELPSDDEVEEGQIMYEKGDDVEVVENVKANEKGIVEKDKDYVTVDVSVKSIPDGKWRVVTQHVPADKFLLVRFPTKKEFDLVKSTSEDSEEKNVRKRQIAETEFWSHETQNRGGLNLFNDQGDELDWDYEHDTRFYDEKVEKEQQKAGKESKFELPKGIKVRGRGAVKCGFLFKGEFEKGSTSAASLASDDQKQIKRKRQDLDEKDMYEKDDVLSRIKPSGIQSRLTYL